MPFRPWVFCGDRRRGRGVVGILWGRPRAGQSVGGRSVHYHDAWAVAGQGPGFTWDIDNPNAHAEMDAIIRQPGHRRRIDYVFVGSWYAHPDAHCYISSAELAFDQPAGGI